MEPEEMELVVTDRVVLVMMWLYAGCHLTPRCVAARTGLTYDGAWKLLGRISRKAPLIEENGIWYMASDVTSEHR